MDRTGRLDIAIAVAAIATWSTAYVAPDAVRPAGEMLLVCGRYILFALCGIVGLMRHRSALAAMPLRRVLFVWHLGVVGYFVFYVAVSFAVSAAGGFLVAVLVGSSPIGIAVVGNLLERRLAWQPFAPRIAAIAAGIALCVAGSGAGGRDGGTPIAGAALALLASATWTYFAVWNARVQRVWRDMPPPVVSAGLVAVGAGSGSLLLLPVALAATPLGALDGHTAVRLSAWIVWLGIFSSWFGTFAWIRASRSLPATLAGPLLACDPVFGAVLSLAYDHRLPTAWEVAGSALIVAGVAGCFTLAAVGGRPEAA